MSDKTPKAYTLPQMKVMKINTHFFTETFMITRVPGGWLYSRAWADGTGAHTVFVAEPKS